MDALINVLLCYDEYKIGPILLVSIFVSAILTSFAIECSYLSVIVLYIGTYDGGVA